MPKLPSITEEYISQAKIRIKAGDKISHIASDFGFTTKRGYEKFRQTLHADGVKKLPTGRKRICPLSGGTVDEYRKHFDRKYWPGAAKYFLNCGQHLPLREIGKKFGFARPRASVVWRNLGGKSRPRGRWMGSYRRPDVTIEKILEVVPRCRSVLAIARELKTTSETITSRVAGLPVILPSGWRKRRPSPLSPT